MRMYQLRFIGIFNICSAFWKAIVKPDIPKIIAKNDIGKFFILHSFSIFFYILQIKYFEIQHKYLIHIYIIKALSLLSEEIDMKQIKSSGMPDIFCFGAKYV